MMVEASHQIHAVARSVQDRTIENMPARAVVLAQVFDTPIDDLWDAVTNKDRIPHWFANITGDLSLNGQFQIENNASGTITRCDRPNAFDSTWEFGGGVSWIEVRLEAIGEDQGRLELTHIAYPDEHWQQFGPGAVGIGWDLSFLGLAEYLATGADIPAELSEWGTSPAAIEFMTQVGNDWIRANIAGGENEMAANERGQRTIAFYTGAQEEA